MLTYPVRIIQDKYDLARSKVFHVDNVLWNSLISPRTGGSMGYIPGKGLMVRMSSHEEPKREYENHMDPVWLDSAMEAFIAFPDRKVAPDEDYTPPDDCLYFNFEINANGAMYAQTGRGRKNREPLLPAEFKLAEPDVISVGDDGMWTIEFIIPQTLIARTAGIEEFQENDVFYCNFTKISEDPKIEHYLSYSPIEADKPNFHLPSFFAKAVITK